MQQDPYASIARPVGQADPYAGIAAPVAAAPAPARQAAPRRPQAAPRVASPGMAAPQSAPLNDLGITDAEERDALIAQGYTPEQADREMDYRRAGNGEPAMFSPEEEAANVQQRGLEAHALDRFENRNSIDPTRAVREPWLLGEPIYMPRDEATGDVQTDDGSYPLTTYPGLRTVEGGMQAFDPASHAYYAVTPEQAATIEARGRQSQKERQARVNREADPKYQAEYAAAQEGADNVPAWLANLTHGDTLGGLTYAVGASNFLDPMTDGIDRNLAAQAGRDAWRDQMDELVAKDPVGSIGMQMVGGLLTPGVKGSGDWIAGANGAARTGRAAVVGGGYGLASGVLNSEGNVVEDGLLGTAVGATTGGLLDMGLRRSASGAAARAAREPSPARRLSRQGVDLTPGQMAGGALRRTEDGLTSIPILGDSIRDAQRRGLGTFDRVATNTALQPIGVTLADTAGRSGVRSADDAIREAYGTALQGVTVSLDDDARAALAAVRRPERMTPELTRNLNAVLDNTLSRFDDGPVPGDVWKQVDSELAAAIRAADRGAASAPEQRILRDRLQEARDAVGGAMERADPMAFADVRAADRAFAQYRLVAKASSDVASAARGGDASPATLNRAVVGANGDMRVARGESLLQDLTDDAMQVMPSTVPDSGSPLRGLMAVGTMGGGATIAGAEPLYVALTAGGLLGGSALYGETAQRIVNSIYRSTDRQSAFSALAELQSAAGRNPALQEHYANAARYLQGVFPDQDTTKTPEATGLLTPTSR